MVSDQHFNVQRAVPFFLHQQKAAASSRSRSLKMMWVAKMPMMLRLDQFQKIIQQYFWNTFPEKITFFGSVLESHKWIIFPSISFPFNWFSVFIKLSKGGAGEGWLVCSTDLRPETDPSTTWSRNPWWPMWTAARRISMTSSVGCGSFTANGTILGGWKTGIFFGDYVFFFRRERKDTPGFPRKTMWNENGDESCRWITPKMNVVFLVSWCPARLFFGTLLTLWLLGDLSSVRCCEFAANLFVNSQDDEWFANNRTRVYNAAWPLKNIGNRFPKFHSNE